MFLTLARDEARARLIAAGYRLVAVWNETCEVWIGRDGVEIGLNPELDGTWCYEEEMIKAAEERARQG